MPTISFGSLVPIFFFFWMFNINIRCNSVSGVCVLQKVFVSKYMFCSGNYPPCTVIQA